MTNKHDVNPVMEVVFLCFGSPFFHVLYLQFYCYIIQRIPYVQWKQPNIFQMKDMNKFDDN